MNKVDKAITYKTTVLAMTALLSACGGGGGGSSSDSYDSPRASTTFTNVALDSEGGSVSSSYSGNESFVIDGDATTVNFWQAGAAGDSITLYLNGVYDVKSITIRSANLTSTADFRLELSADGISYTTLNLVSVCLNLSLGAAGYSCEFRETKEAQELRLTILQKPESIEIYEWEVQGKM